MLALSAVRHFLFPRIRASDKILEIRQKSEAYVVDGGGLSGFAKRFTNVGKQNIEIVSNFKSEQDQFQHVFEPISYTCVH